MNRLIINFNDADISKALDRTVEAIKVYREVLQRDGKRITATWDTPDVLYISHGKGQQGSMAIYSKEER